MTDRVIPEAFGDEDGERWWLQGHVDPPMAVLAVVLDKKAFDTKRDAAAFARENGVPTTYQCSICGKWHLSSRLSPQGPITRREIS